MLDGLTLYSLILLPAGLGLLGFIEPCTIGGHLIFLGTQEGRGASQRRKAFATFVGVRVLVAGGFGAMIALLGQTLIGMQTGLWLVFGLVYGMLGLAFLWGKTGALKIPLQLAPAAWRHASNPFALGLAFGLNIPACAAPILFGLMAMAATAGTFVAGFLMMAMFGLALSLPLAVFVFAPSLTKGLHTVAGHFRRRGWILGAIFLLLGVWSVWFGLYVDPADWSGR